jgi:preprotein translocase subunit SecG
MFYTFVLIVHVIVCIAMILIILLQSGKGADIGAAFGGGSSQTVFGSTGAGTLLSKVTIAAAVIFMTTSIVLTYFAGKTAVTIDDKSLMSGQAAPESSMPVKGALPSGPEGKSEPVPEKAETPVPAGKEGATPAATVPAAPEKAPAAAPAPEAASAPAPAPAAPAAPSGGSGEAPAEKK